MFYYIIVQNELAFALLNILIFLLSILDLSFNLTFICFHIFETEPDIYSKTLWYCYCEFLQRKSYYQAMVFKDNILLSNAQKPLTNPFE